MRLRANETPPQRVFPVSSLASTLLYSNFLLLASIAPAAEDAVPFAQLTASPPSQSAQPDPSVPFTSKFAGEAELALGSLPSAANEPGRGDAVSDHLFPRPGASMLTLMTGIPYVGVAEYAYGFTDRFSVGIFAGVITPEIQGYGLRPRYILAQPSRHLRVHVKAPLIYYPASPGLKSWFLAWPTLSAEWHRENGMRLWTGVGVVATNGGISAGGGGGYRAPAAALAPAPAKRTGYGSSSYGSTSGTNSYGVGSHASSNGASLTKIAGTSEGGIWNTFQLGFSKPMTRRVNFQFEAAAVLKGTRLSPSDRWIAGPPVIVTTGLTYSF